MDVQTLRSLLRQRPFEPFRIILSDAPTQRISRPEAAFLTRTSLVVGKDLGDDGVPDGFTIVPLSQITRVDRGPRESS